MRIIEELGERERVNVRIGGREKEIVGGGGKRRVKITYFPRI